MAAVAALKEQLKQMIVTLIYEGMLDDQFRQILTMPDTSNSGILEELTVLFCETTAENLENLTAIVENQDTDYGTAYELIIRMKGSTLSIGAREMSNSCGQLEQSCKKKDKESLLATLNMLKNQFFLLRGKFDTMIQLEKSIKLLQASQP